jgi:hypothetical protein
MEGEKARYLKQFNHSKTKNTIIYTREPAIGNKIDTK